MKKRFLLFAMAITTAIAMSSCSTESVTGDATTPPSATTDTPVQKAENADVIYASSIGEVNGVAYAAGEVNSLKTLPVETYGKRIAVFCEYDGYVYYTLSDDCSSDYGTWLYRCKNDFTNEELIDGMSWEQNPFGYREFFIDNNKLYYDSFWSKEDGTYFDLSDMSKHSAPCPIHTVTDGDRIIDRSDYENDIYIHNGKTYFTDENRKLYEVTETGSKLLAENAYLDGGFAAGSLYYVEWDMDTNAMEADLYKLSDDGSKIFIDSRMPAGGGGPFFCW